MRLGHAGTRACAILLAGALLLAGLSPRPTFAAGGAQGHGAGKLSRHAQDLLAQARARGDSTVTLLIAAYPGANSAVAQGIQTLGGAVKYREDDVNYIRATVPTAQAEAAAALAGVQYADLDEVIPLDDPRVKPDGATAPTPQPPPSAATPNNNPYMPIGDIGASQFMAAHPTWDGRGVTIGILDTGIDLHHPSLTTTSTGERKIVDWVTFTDPFTDQDPTWVDMAAQVSGLTFVHNGVTYTAPAAGSYRIGLFDERDFRLGGEVQNDVNRDGNPSGSSGIFAVLWNAATNTVWVDTNQNRSFADDTPMTDYKVNHDVNYFGVDNPATDVREAMPFVVQTDGKNKVVNIGIVSGAHGSHVAGIAAGHQLFGGAMSGAAPGAQLVSVRVCLFISGCTAHALIEGMIYAAKQSNVDVINMSIGGLPSLNDGNNSRAELYNRLVEQYKVQIFISAGNSGPGLNTVGDPSVATNVMSVGTYISKDTWQKNYGSDSAHVDNQHNFSSRGPREDGGFKPQLIASGAAISPIPTWQPGEPVAGTYPLPPGYGMFNGTSMSAPQATGAAGLLISAAKQYGAQHKPAQLRQAMISATRLLDTSRIQVHEQGNGLIDVGAAWNLLKRNIKTAEIGCTVPVNTALSDFLAVPGQGVGIYDREGVSTGAAYTRTYTCTRTKGGAKAVTYNLSWVGNGAFSSATSIALPLNEPVPLDVDINPTTAGAHSAILNFDDPGTPGIDYQTMNVVIAAGQFTGTNSYAIVNTGTVGRNQDLSFFFDVPPSASALRVDFSGPSTAAGTGQARFLRFHPFGVPVDSNVSTANYCPSATAPSTCPASALSRSVANPQPGVWEVTVDARRTADVADTAFTLTASILGASVSPDPDVIPVATVGVPVARSYTITNLAGPFTGRAASAGALGSAFMDAPTIADLAQQTYTVGVTAGSTSLRATIGSPSDPAADLDLYVYNCTTGPCVLAGQSADGDSEESVTIGNPAAGLWMVVVDGFSVPAGTTKYDYVDVFTNAGFGSVSVTDANALRPAGAVWTVPGSVTALSAPAVGRVLLGGVQVRTDTNLLVGSGDVIIESVTP